MVVGDIINSEYLKMDIERIKMTYSMKIAQSKWMGLYGQYVKETKIGSDAKLVWNELIRYTFADTCKIDIKKGIGLIGKTGSGKTITMHTLNDFINVDEIKYMRGKYVAQFKFHMVSAINISARYSEEGYAALDKFSRLSILCIDDLGSEPRKSKHFGEEINVIEQLIENRYSNKLITHFTSNLQKDDIKEIYGDRVYSRIIESINIIRLNDRDYRLSENK